jgi:hypothetical protein
MPVIIDQLDLVDTEPEAAGEAAATAPHPTTGSGDRLMRSLRLAAQRAARVRAD